MDIEFKTNGKQKTLVLTIPVTDDKGSPVKGKDSQSGKSEVIASTYGNQSVGEGLTLGLNLYRRK